MSNLNLDLCNKVVEVKQIHPDWGRCRIAKHLSCSESSVRTILARYEAGELQQIIDVTTSPEQDVVLQKKVKDVNTLRRKYIEALNTIQELEERLNSVQQLENMKKVLVDPNFQIMGKDPREAVAVAVASDWHVDEVVDPLALGGLNEFNLDVARKRIKVFFENTLLLLRMVKSESTINTLVLAALGDFISGWIHEELLASNSMTPPEAIVELFNLLSEGIKFLITNGDIRQLMIVYTCGNHSRITQKSQFKNAPKKSYEWPLYTFLTKWFANSEYSDKISFKLPTGYFNYLQIANKLVRFHHGDGIRYGGGVGGIHIPLRKAIAQWNKAKKVDLDVMGHWHTRELSRDYVINGSLIGYNEYAERIKADYEPPQQSFFIIHPKHGKTNECGISLSR